MYTWDIESNGKGALRTAFIYLLCSLFVMLFGAVYEIYSHGVYSYFMLYAFAFPLLGGTLVFHLLSFMKLKRYPDLPTRILYHCAVATFTAGSIVRGVLDIYGTTSSLTKYYWYAGALLLSAAVLSFVSSHIRYKTEK